ncbi:MAG: purine/pyrimidine permease, partial [Victivallales bacterium]|nr:purine/pyrimidine permease [Victivallales bacterium]
MSKNKYGHLSWGQGESKSLQVVAALQQTLSMFAGLVMVPLIIARAIGADAESQRQIVTMAILVSGITTCLQCGKLPFIGSGYLLMMGSSSMFIAPSIMAGKMGGLAMVFGMTMAMAPVEIILSPFARHLKKIAPPIVIGVIVTLLACAVLPVSLKQFGGGYGPDYGTWRHICLGTFTIVCILAAQYSPWKFLRTGSIVFGLIVGYIVGHFMGMASYDAVAKAAWLGCPKPFWYGMPDFSFELMLPFGIAYVLTTLETYGDIHAIAMVSNDGKPVKVENERVSGGLLADGLGSLLAGLGGTTANTTFSGNIAIAQMSGVTNHAVGFQVAVMLILLSLLPKLSALISAMPAAVLGGS